eukprot:708386-Pleurochrysis_carterae.AAC.1
MGEWAFVPGEGGGCTCVCASERGKVARRRARLQEEEELVVDELPLREEALEEGEEDGVAEHLLQRELPLAR